jgi:hypothetical protein
VDDLVDRSLLFLEPAPARDPFSIPEWGRGRGGAMEQLADCCYCRFRGFGVPC